MRLYLDDNTVSAKLALLLRQGGHEVVLPADAGTAGISDPRHLAHAIQQNLIVLTRDHEDFEDLHHLLQVAGGSHPGMLVIRFDSNPAHDMKPHQVAKAVSKFVASGMDTANAVIVLNHWR